MRNILITSSGVARQPIREEISRIVPSSEYPNLAYITTASKVVKDPLYAVSDKEKLQGLGFTVTEIDLADTQKERLEDKLRQNNTIYVQGGNPYWLLKQMKESGFNEIAPKLINEGMPYIGKSAGGYILAPEVIVPTWYENMWRKFDVTDLKGMGVVDFVWAAHFKPEDKQMRKDIENGVRSSPYPVRVITDDQAFWINDEGVQFLGEGSEFHLDYRSKIEGGIKPSNLEN